MDFTRHPVIETVITPKEGWKLVLRKSQGVGQEEYFVDAIEIVSFGQALFYRSLERPKNFLLPVQDYELLEVKEARMVLKHVAVEKKSKQNFPKQVKKEKQQDKKEESKVLPPQDQSEDSLEKRLDSRLEKKRDRRRNYRRKRTREDSQESSQEEPSEESKEPLPLDSDKSKVVEESDSDKSQYSFSLKSSKVTTSQPSTASLLPPPPRLISDTIARYKDNKEFKGAFYAFEDADNQAQENLGVPEEEDDFKTLEEPKKKVEENSDSEYNQGIEVEKRVETKNSEDYFLNCDDDSLLKGQLDLEDKETEVTSSLLEEDSEQPASSKEDDLEPKKSFIEKQDQVDVSSPEKVLESDTSEILEKDNIDENSIESEVTTPTCDDLNKDESVPPTSY